MPGFDQTGPNGAGPLTGGGFGQCAGGGMRLGRQGCGRGFRSGFGRGGGGGRGAGRWGARAGGDESAVLRAQASILRGNLEAIEKRLAEVEPKE